MGYTTPYVPTAGTVWKAADFNTYVGSNLKWLATDSPSCRVYNNADVSIASAVDTAPTFNSERYDNAAMHDTGSNTSRITIPTGGAGKYLIGGCVDWNGAVGGTIRNLKLRLNGATALVSNQTVNSGNGTSFSVATVYAMSAADYFEATVFQNSGSPLSIASVPNESPEMWAFWFRT